MTRRVLKPSWLLASILLIAGVGYRPHVSYGAEPARYDVTLPSLPLEDALQEFARQSGVQIVFFSGLTRGLQAPALSGEYTLEAALERLLSASSLGFRVVNSQTVEIRQASPQSPALAQRTSAARPAGSGDQKVEEVVVVGTAEQLVATRVPTPLEEIPQSISVISHEQIQQRNDVDLADVLRQATGIVARRATSVGEQLYVRSFRVTSIHIDGGAGVDPATPEPFSLETTPDLSEYDHVEILRGSDALFASDSNPGGPSFSSRATPMWRRSCAR